MGLGKSPMGSNGNSVRVYISLFMSWAGSILDPTRTRLVGVGWRVEKPKTDYRNQSVESILGESERQSIQSVARN